MNNNIFRMVQTAHEGNWTLSKRSIRKHWHSLFGLSLLFFTFFNLYSPTTGYHIDTAQEQISYDVATSILTDSEESPSPCTPQQEDIVLDTLLIGVPSDATESSVQGALQVDSLRDLVVEKFWPEFNMALVRIPEQDSSPIIAAHADAIQRLERYRQILEQIPEIQYVNYNSWLSVADWIAPSPSTHSAYAHQLSTETVEYVEQDPANSEETVVALIDSGYGTLDVDNTTYSLWENQVEIDGISGVDDDKNGFVDDYNGWDWIDNDNVANDEHGHGTWIGDTVLDVIEQQGIDRNSIKIQPLRILNADGRGEIADLIDALAYVARKGVTIVNLSVISYYNAPALEHAIEIIYEQGLLAIAPVGSCSQYTYWPASYPETFVTSILCSPKTDDDICHIHDIVDITVQIDASDVVSTSSTSSAPPYVVAAAALILDQHPKFSNADIESIILSTAFYPEDLPAETLVLDIDAIVEKLEMLGPNLNAAQLDKKLYLPLITN